MYDGKIQRSERMRAAPPAGGVGRVTTVSSPAIAFVFVEAVVFAYIFGESYSFKNAHVFAAGEYIGSFDSSINVESTA